MRGTHDAAGQVEDGGQRVQDQRGDRGDHADPDGGETDAGRDDAKGAGEASERCLGRRAAFSLLLGKGYGQAEDDCAEEELWR